MKTSFYIFLVLLLSITFGNAQSNEVSVAIESNRAVSFINDEDGKEVVSDEKTLVNNPKEEATLINNDALKQIIARTSDIRIYFNRKRKVGNISMLFPRINKPVKA